MTLIMVSVGVRYLFYQPIDEKIKKMASSLFRQRKS